MHFFRVVSYSCCTFLCVKLLSSCTFSRVASCSTHFTLHLFYVALISCCTFFILNSFQVSLFLCCTLFVLHFAVLHLFHFAPFLSSTFFVLCSFRVALFLCCTLFMSHLFSCCSVLMLYLLCNLFMLHFFRVVRFRVVLFQYYTFFMLNSFHVALNEALSVSKSYNKVIVQRMSGPILLRSEAKVFCKKGALGNFAKFTKKHLCQSLFFNKVAGLTQV